MIYVLFIGMRTLLLDGMVWFFYGIYIVSLEFVR